ncbi:MAG: DNA internalization-related competence protein ComEC/Rec2 [Betaproteobacteria bacterium]|nr:DNA internalization-related competence protein ComEC/Rec2 [Betaproteobacteria bacterium]
MVLPTVAFVAGVALLQIQPHLPPPLLAGWLAAPLLVLAILQRMRAAPRVLNRVALCLAAGSLGFFWAAGCAHVRLAEELPVAWEGRDVRVVGVVAGLPQPFERGVRFRFDVEQMLTPGAVVPRHVLVSWYGVWRRDDGPVALPAVRAGERWQFSLRLRRPHGTANPHGFDYEAWLLERGIRATGYVRVQELPRRLDEFVAAPSYAVERLREHIRSRILRGLEDEPYAGVIAALVMGDQHAIPAAQWTVFTRTGVNHLMSISGLHVTMIAALAFMLVYALWRHVAWLALRLPARRAAVLAGLVAAVGYAAIAGFAIPAQRTVYMLGVMAAVLWLGQISSAASVLAAALLVVTVLDPWAVMAPGFWLSFGAVGVILYVAVGSLRPPHWALAWARTQWAVTLGLVPLLLAMFQQISLVSPAANAFAIQAISLVVVPAALLGAALPFDFILQLAHAAMALTMAGLEWLAAMPESVWQQHAPPPWSVAVALCGIGWILLPRGFPARWIGAAGLLPLFLVLPPPPPSGSVRMIVLDVGQGLAIVIRTHRHALLYDAGPAYAPDADSGIRIVVPYLRASGVRRLDGMIVSHADADHAGGAASVLAAVPVGWLASSLPGDHGLHAAARESGPCLAGQRWEWDGVRFEMLHPLVGHDALRLKANDRSCVLRMTIGATRVLIAGDIEARSEHEMLHRGVSVRAEILVAPHHGSITSSTPEFVATVHPDVAVFSAGYRNRFRHPRPEVVERYQQIGSRILRSDRQGALEFEIADPSWQITAERERRRRYWQDAPEGD